MRAQGRKGWGGRGGGGGGGGDGGVGGGGGGGGGGEGGGEGGFLKKIYRDEANSSKQLQMVFCYHNCSNVL